MNYDAVTSMSNPYINELLQKCMPALIHFISQRYLDYQLTLVEKICIANFIKTWDAWILRLKTFTRTRNFLIRNVYLSTELNAYSLIRLSEIYGVKFEY